MKQVMIIGGGVAGLSAGIFAQLNGFASTIIEKHHTVGGECTGWDRQGYHIDGCIHWLVGTKPGTQLHDLWNDVGALDGVECFHPEAFMTVEHDGSVVPFYRDLKKLESSWLALSPTDEDAISDFCQTIRRLQAYEVSADKPMDLMTILQKARLMYSLKDVGLIMSKYGKTSLQDYAHTFRHPALREALATFLPDEYSASSIFFALASFTKGDASIPYGGSRALAMRMEERYRTLGGTIKTSCEAIDLCVGHSRAHCVICADDQVYDADYFVAASDPYVLYERLLKGKYPDQAFQKRYRDNRTYPVASNIYVALGYSGSMGDIPRTLRFPITPFRIHETAINHLTITHYGYEPTFAPEGHSLITCAINQFGDDYEAWHTLASNAQAYREQKARIGEQVCQAIETRFSEMAGKLKVLDVASPITYEKHCNAYHGAFMAFLPTIHAKAMSHTGRIKGLENVFMCGQWLQPPGGLPVAVMTGKHVIMRLCSRERRPFIHSYLTQMEQV